MACAVRKVRRICTSHSHVIYGCKQDCTRVAMQNNKWSTKMAGLFSNAESSDVVKTETERRSLLCACTCTRGNGYAGSRWISGTSGYWLEGWRVREDLQGVGQAETQGRNTLGFAAYQEVHQVPDWGGEKSMVKTPGTVVQRQVRLNERRGLHWLRGYRASTRSSTGRSMSI